MISRMTACVKGFGRRPVLAYPLVMRASVRGGDLRAVGTMVAADGLPKEHPGHLEVRRTTFLEC